MTDIRADGSLCMILIFDLYCQKFPAELNVFNTPILGMR